MGPKFVLASSYEEGREFWSEFDKIYPHYVLERYLEEGVGDLNRMMFIFKNYMQEVCVFLRRIYIYNSSDPIGNVLLLVVSIASCLEQF